MDDARKGKIYALIFAVFLLMLVICGYILTKELLKGDEHQEKSQVENTVQDKLKIDKNEEYIYFTNIDTINEEKNIIYEDIIINLNSSDATYLTNTLNNEMNSLRNSLKKISDTPLTDEEKEQITNQEMDIYSATYRRYTRYFYNNYASILSDEYDYNCTSGETYKESKAYVFDTNTGVLLSNANLFALYDTNLNKIKEEVKEKLESQSKIETRDINIDETLSNLDNNYALYINKSGFLTISYIVKTNELDYNDIIVLS